MGDAADGAIETRSVAQHLQVAVPQTSPSTTLFEPSCDQLYDQLDPDYDFDIKEEPIEDVH